MISCNQGNRHYVDSGKPEDLAVLNEILGVLVVGVRAHIPAALMKERGDLQKQGVTLLKVMQGRGLVEELAAQSGDLVGVIDIHLVPFADDSCRADNLVMKAGGQSRDARKVRQKSAFEIAVRNSQRLQSEDLGDGKICKERGHDRINSMVIELVTVDAFLFGNLGQFPDEGLEGLEGDLRGVILGEEGDEMLDLEADDHQVLNALVFIIVENLADLS